MEQNQRGSFTGKLGFVLSAAGASVGLGNIWRFPYLAAKYGGGAFLLVYIILALTFGYTMIIAETAIGRSTQKSPVSAFRFYSKSPYAKAGGWLNAIVPMLICPYYSVIGGWVCKYLFAFLTTDMDAITSDTFFTVFITNGVSAEFWFFVFLALTLAIIYMGVENGIERVSKFMMPILLVLAIVISVYTITRPGAMAGVAYLLIPHLENFSWMTVVSAMGQMFYSLSIAMGILITFGSYMPVFTVGEGFGRSIASALNAPFFATSHQEGHIRAAMVDTALSVRAMELVSAAKSTSVKNRMPIMRPKPMLAKILGIVMNMREGPAFKCSGSPPEKAKTAGMIIIPAKIAMAVSKNST